MIKTPDKTNDWDRDHVHGDGDTMGLSLSRGLIRNSNRHQQDFRLV